MLPPYQKYLMFILPFSNEIANALTISDEKVFKRLYKPCNSDFSEKFNVSFINFIALLGICWNVSYIGSKYGTKMGIINGIFIVLLSFIIPNTFMEYFVNKLPHSETGYIRIIGSVVFILVLLSCEIIITSKLNKRLSKT